MLKNKLKEIGVCISAQFSVIMPDTWTPVFDVSDKEKMKKINEKADRGIDKIIRKIKKNTIIINQLL